MLRIFLINNSSKFDVFVVAVTGRKNVILPHYVTDWEGNKRFAETANKMKLFPDG